MNRMYSEQTGREMSDYILVQQADKVVRYNQLPPEAEVFRKALLKWNHSQDSDCCKGERIALNGMPSGGESHVPPSYRVRVNVRMSRTKASEESTGVPALIAQRNRALLRKETGLSTSERHLIEMPDSKVLLSTNQLASLTGFKTIRRWVSRKLLNYIRVGNQYRFRAAAVELFLAQREVHK